MIFEHFSLAVFDIAGCLSYRALLCSRLGLCTNYFSFDVPFLHVLISLCALRYFLSHPVLALAFLNLCPLFQYFVLFGPLWSSFLDPLFFSYFHRLRIAFIWLPQVFSLTTSDKPYVTYPIFNRKTHIC